MSGCLLFVVSQKYSCFQIAFLNLAESNLRLKSFIHLLFPTKTKTGSVLLMHAHGERVLPAGVKGIKFQS